MRTPTPGRRAPLMRRGAAPRAAFLLLALVISACDGDSPTAPAPTPYVAGTWSTSILSAPPGSDWSSVRITLQQAGTDLSGTATGVDGATWELAGELFEPEGVDGWWLRLSVAGLPGTSECSSYRLLGTDLQANGAGYVSSISGRIDGRCFGTLSAPFELLRTGG